MPTTEHLQTINRSPLRWIVYTLLASTTLVVAINSYDSGILKGPLLVLCSTLLVAMFLAQSLWEQKLEFHLTSSGKSVAAFLLLMVGSMLYTKHQWESQQAIPIWTAFLVCFFAGSQLFPTKSDRTRLLRVISIITAVVCLVGFVQFFFADKLFLDFFLGEGRRITSTLTNAIYLGSFIVVIFPVLLSFAIGRERRPRERWVIVALLCGMVFVLIATGTRSSMIALFISIIVFAFVSKRTGKKPLVLASLGVALAVASSVFLSHGIIERIEKTFANERTSTLARRWYFWDAGIKAFKAAPLLGHGIGTYQTVMLDYRSPEYWVAKSEDVVPHAHNELIETAVDLGSVGLTLYVAIVVMVLSAGFKSKPKEDSDIRLLRVGLSCSLVAVLVDNLTNMSLRVEPVGSLAWLFMGVLASMSSPTDQYFSLSIRAPRSTALIPVLLWGVFAFWYCSSKVDAYDSDSHTIKAVLRSGENNLIASIEEYKTAISSNPHNLLARSNLSFTLLKAGRSLEALHAAEELQSLSPHYPKSNLMQGVALVMLRRNAEALAKLDSELLLRTHPDAYYYRVLAYKGVGDSVGERSAIRQLLLASMKEQTPYQSAYVAGRIRQLVVTKEHVSSFKDLYEDVYAMFPTDRSTVMTLAWLCAEAGDSSRASGLLRGLPPIPPDR